MIVSEENGGKSGKDWTACSTIAARWAVDVILPVVAELERKLVLGRARPPGAGTRNRPTLVAVVSQRGALQDLNL